MAQSGFIQVNRKDDKPSKLMVRKMNLDGTTETHEGVGWITITLGVDGIVTVELLESMAPWEPMEVD